MQILLITEKRLSRNPTQAIAQKTIFCFSINVLKRWSFNKNCAGIWWFLYCQERWYFFFPKISSYSLEKWKWKWKMIFLKKILQNMIFFSNVLKRWPFQNNRTGIWSFLLYYLERWYFFFSKIWSYSLDGKWKMTFLKKIHGNIIFSSNASKRWSFRKKITLEYDLSCIIWKDVFFPENVINGKWKMKDDISQEIHGNMIFSVYTYKCYEYDITLLLKIKGWSSLEKIHLKVIDILDRILERVPTIIYTFLETFIGVFLYCFSVKKPQET